MNEYLAIHPELKARGMNFSINKADQKSSADLAKIIRIVRSVILFLVIISLVIFVSVKTTAFFKNMKAVKKTQYSKNSKTATRAEIEEIGRAHV